MVHASEHATSLAHCHRLANGMPLLFEPLPYVHSVSVGIWAKAGSVHEAYEYAGVSHFLEHLFFKGTATRSAHELMEAIEKDGGHLNAFTTRDYTCVYVRALSQHTAAAIEILTDIVLNSELLDFEKERNVILEEIATNEDIPEDFVHDCLSLASWPGHSLGYPVAGFEKTVGKLSPDQVRHYYRERYTPSNMLFTIAGRFDEAAVRQQIESAFEGLAPANVPTDPSGPRFAPGVQGVERDIAQHHICLGFPGPTMTDDDRLAYELLSSTLGGGSTSRLFERIREDEGLAYSIYSFRSSYGVGGMIGMYAAVAPENVERTMELACQEMQDLKDKVIGQDEFSLNREQVKGGFLMGLESTFARMSRMAKNMIYHGRIIAPEETVAMIEAVTAEDIHALANRVFNRDSCCMAIVGPSGLGQLTEVPLQ